MERDVIISTGLEAIENKIKNLKKPDENYKFKTNCKFDNENIKTMTYDKLLETLAKINIYREALDAVFERFQDKFDKFEPEMYGFSYNAWESDIIFLAEKIKYNVTKKDLEAKANALRNFYSEDKKTDMAINEILASL